MFKGILFDLDGTLVDSLSVTFDAFNHGIETQGGRHHSPAELMRYFGAGENQILTKILGPERAEKGYQAICDYLDENIAKVPLHAGIGDLLESLKSRSLPLSIVTGRSWKTTEKILKHHRLLDRFITVVADDHVSTPKPSPEGLSLALNRMKLLPNEVFYVGDTDSDIYAAHRAGAVAVAATWDLLAHRENLKIAKPQHWVQKSEDLLLLLT